MKVGAVFREFTVRERLRVILRTSLWRDLDDLLELVNSVVAEQAPIYINMDRPPTRENEADWLASTLARVEKGEGVHVVAEVDGRVIGGGEVTKRTAYMSHVGDLGILVKEEFRDRGIGTEMVRTLIDEAKKIGVEVFLLRCFAENARAIHVYEKVGFKEVGREPKAAKQAGRYHDLVIMAFGP